MSDISLKIERGPGGVVAVYFRLSLEPVAETIESEDSEDVLLDLDATGALVGVEMINPSSVRVQRLVKSVGTKYGVNAFNELSQSRIERLQALIGAR